MLRRGPQSTETINLKKKDKLNRIVVLSKCNIVVTWFTLVQLPQKVQFLL